MIVIKLDFESKETICMQFITRDPWESDNRLEANWWLKESTCDYCFYKKTKKCDSCSYKGRY